MDDLLAVLLGSADAADAYRTAEEDDRLALIQRQASAAEADDVPRMLVLDRIAEGSDPHVVDTAERLLAGGMAPDRVLAQTAIVLTTVLLLAIEEEDDEDADGGGFDEEGFHRELDALPLPESDAVRDAFLAVAAEHVAVNGEELLARVAERLGVSTDQTTAMQLIDQVDELLGGAHGPLVWLADDTTVSAEAIVAGLVLTHRLDAEEIRTGCLDLGFDLAILSWADAPTIDGQDLQPHVHDDDAVYWSGPEGWLGDHQPGDLLAVAIDADQRVVLEAVGGVPTPSPALVAATRAAYDAELGEAGLPVPGRDLLARMRVTDRSVLSEPQAPLTTLCTEGGLERSGNEVAHDATVWHEARRLTDMQAIREAVGEDDELYDAAIAVIHVCDILHEGSTLAEDQVAAMLDDLADLDVLTLVEHALLDARPAPDRTGPTIAEVLVGLARRPRHVAVTRYVAAIQSEQDGDAEAAEQHLEAAVAAAPDFPPSTDRLAWYASDRGDATRAVRLWQRLPLTATAAADIAACERFMEGVATMNRNDPCWCGSGRKYKRCHLGKPVMPTLPDRAGWLWRKAAAYMERGGAEALDAMWQVVTARMDGEPQDWAQALADPLVVDLALVEGGWFPRFLADRGVLLPEDELVLAGSWPASTRRVHTVTEVVPGTGLTLTDATSGTAVTVRDRTLSGTVAVGELLCARVVPDGEGHQLVGAVLPLRPEEAATVTEALASGDPLQIAEVVGRLERQPA